MMIPVLINSEKSLKLTKTKYLMRSEMKVINLMAAIRRCNKDCMNERNGMFLFCDNILLRPDTEIGIIYKEFKKDNHLNITCCIENVFG